MMSLESPFHCMTVTTETASLCISLNLLFQFIPIVSNPPTMHHCEEPDSIPHMPCKAAVRSAPKDPLLQDDRAKLPQFFLTEQVCQPLPELAPA